MRIARAEAGEAAAVMEALVALAVVEEEEADTVLALLWRLCAMLHQLGKRSG